MEIIETLIHNRKSSKRALYKTVKASKLNHFMGNTAVIILHNSMQISFTPYKERIEKNPICSTD